MATPAASLPAPSYPVYKAEDSSVYSPWLYGNHTARCIAYIRNSDLAQSAYNPNGSEKSSGNVIVYGICLAAAAVFGFCCDAIRNFLAFVTVYFAGKKIYEFTYDEGDFAKKPIPAPQPLQNIRVVSPTVPTAYTSTFAPISQTAPINLPLPTPSPTIPVGSLRLGPRILYIPTPLPDRTETPLPDMTRTPLPDMTRTPLPDMTRTPLPDMTRTPLPDMTRTPLPDMTRTPMAQPPPPPQPPPFR